MMRALGLPTDLEFDDTMVMAYLLQLEPQGLKQGALRLCNMQMQSYQDIMGDADNRLARSYLTWLWERAVFRYEAECEQELVNRLRAGRRCKVIPKLPKPAFLKAIERCLSSPRPRGLWEDQDEAIVSEGVRTLGFVPEASLSHVEPAKAIWYGCRDADATIRYRDQLWPRIEAMGLEDTYRLEMATYPLIDRMAQIGIKPDVDYFTRFGVQLGEEIADLRTELELLTERPGFNANSGDHVAEYLFSTLGLPVGKLTESGRGTTDKKYLKDLEFSYPEYPQIGVIRTYRERYKLKHSFVDVIPTLIKGWPHDGRVHVEFRTTRIPTGRLAASMPRGFPKYNMLAQPKRGKHAKTFRKGWVAEDGHWLGSWDLSQIELRIGAHLSQDPYMLAIYRGEIRNPDGSPIDLHAGLGQRIFGVPKRDQTVEQRTSAKEINFGFWMGQTAKGLKVSLRSNGVMVSEGDAQLWLDEANKTYAGAQPYKDRMIEQARQQGFVRCLSGRIRYIGGITSKDDRIREEAERFAFGTPVQEGAQWLMKQAEARLWADLNYFWKRGRWVEPLLQIHDDLLLELEDDILLARELHTAMVRNLTTIPKGFSVPVETSGDYGRNWAEMTSF